MSRISVAMAVYNGEKYLSEQLDSILTQIEPQDELVVSYDVSTDKTWELLQSYQKRFPQIKVLKNENSGIAGNFDNAIAACTGEYIFICDQDDLWSENKRTCVLETFEKTGADMVIHNGVHIDSDGEVVSDPFFSMYYIGAGKMRNLLKPRYSGCCTAFTSNIAKKILPIPQYIHAYDHWIGSVGEFMGKIAYDNRILLYHRLHQDNATPVRRRLLVTVIRTRIHLMIELEKRIWQERKRKCKQQRR